MIAVASSAQPANPLLGQDATFPRLALRHAQVRPNRPAIREKRLGIWQTRSWRDLVVETSALACGLHSLGFVRGDRLGLIGDNRPRLYGAMLAAQMLGGIPTPMYQDAVAAEILFVLQDAGIRIAIAEDQEQVDKLLEIRTQCPQLAYILYDEPRGLAAYGAHGLLSLDEVIAKGRKYFDQQPEFIAHEIEQGQADDVAVMLYTSGTTGRPKGVCQTFRAFIAAGRGGIEVDHHSERDEVLSYLPMAWVGDHLFSYAQALVAGMTVNCPESGDTVMTDMREIGPTYYFAPPRVFENLLTQLQIRLEDASRAKRWLFQAAMKVARRCGADILDGKPVGLLNRLLYGLGNLTIYAPLRNVLGLSRIRVAYTAGAAIGPDLFRFYRSIGVNLKQLYGQTETCAFVCVQPDDEVRLDTVGKATPGTKIKIAENGEIRIKGPTLMSGYWQRADATAESLDAEGYFMTGDAGFLDAHGHLKIIDRAKDVGQLNNGAIFAPNYIENKLKFFPHIKEAVCFGHQRDEVCAFINIDVGSVGNWAERRNLAYSGYTDLAGKGEVLELIRDCVAQVNQELAIDDQMAATQIKRFLVLHKELDPDDDELTRTRKVRRNFVAEKYAVLIDALYGGKTSQFIETEVKFEDGRRGRVAADLPIVSVA